MKLHYLNTALASLFVLGVASCSKQAEQVKYFEMVPVQENTSTVLWDPEVYDFEAGNQYSKEHFEKAADKMKGLAAGCTSWRNGQFHGRNLDWYQANYGCLIVQMPKGGKVKHASVGTINSNTIVTSEFIKQGVISDEMRKVLPASTIDGINDAGVAININIVPHQPGDKYIDNMEGDLCCNCVVRYVLDNAGSVTEAVDLIKSRTVGQSIVKLAGDEAHYMISNADSTVVVEFPQGEMQVTYFNKNEQGWYSKSGNPAIMANFYDYAGEQYPVGSDEFYNFHPTAMGVERWMSVKEQYDNAKKDVASNFAIAKSVWYFKNLIVDKTLWYTDNAVPVTGYGKDEQGWYYVTNDQRVDVENAQQAMQGYWDANMEQYWKDYEEQYGHLADPHIAGNTFWETSHSIVFDIQNKKGYLYPFENRYSENGEPIVIALP